MSWEVQLLGDPIDLRMLADSFTSTECQVIQSGNEYMLRADQFELLDGAASVRQRAIELYGQALLYGLALRVALVWAIYRPGSSLSGRPATRVTPLVTLAPKGKQ
jgi:hypothetical protein